MDIGGLYFLSDIDIRLTKRAAVVRLKYLKKTIYGGRQ